jgi:selenocysteine lyase/cysteine desulfurase
MHTTTAVHPELANITIDDLPSLLIGCDTEVPTLHGPKRYVNLDNAASTPTFSVIEDSIRSFLRWYSNVHRGTGFKSQLASWAFEQARDIAAEFVGADLDKQIVIYTKNSTEAINKLANRLPLSRNDVIVTTLMEHHSNELPWRRAGNVVHVGLNDDGTISQKDFIDIVHQYGKRIKLVAITGASNVTGYINDLDFFARETHKIGAKILVDGAQLIPHRPIDMKPHDPQHRLDYLVFSGHKMYAPFGVGVLVGDKAAFEFGPPETVGGGVVDIVTLEEAYWTDLPEKEEAGTPDIVGVVALARAMRLFQTIGWEEIIKHESELTAYALTELAKIDKVILYGDTDPNNAYNRLGVISMNIEGIDHALVAAMLSYEGAIGVRSGCFCAHTYVKELLHVADEDSRELERQILERDRSKIPGTIRASFGIYNTREEVDRFIAMIKQIAEGKCTGEYTLNKEKGEYSPVGFSVDLSEYYRV